MMVSAILVTIGLTILLIVLAMSLMRALGNDKSSPIDPTAREILDQRYARGEIDREEYQRRLKNISCEP